MDFNHQTNLLHLRLGYSRLNKIKRLVRDPFLKSLQMGPLRTCESYLGGKMSHRLFYKKGTSATNSFDCELLVPLGHVLGICLQVRITSNQRISIETKGYIFYSPSDNKIVCYKEYYILRRHYVINMKPRNRIFLEEL